MYGVFKSMFCAKIEKRLDLKSLKGWTKAEELAGPVRELLSLRLSMQAL